ncbi:MAG: hypothetical protein ACFFD4_27195 [Candidatus Odinarchaeota archaeon]
MSDLTASTGKGQVDLVILKFFQTECLIDENQIVELLGHAGSFLNRVGTNSLNKQQAEELEESSGIEGIKIFQGGRQALFGAAFPVDDFPFKYVMIKPYSNLTLSQIILHCVSLFEFRKQFSGRKYYLSTAPGKDTEEWEVRSVYTIGFGKLRAGNQNILALIQEYSEGEKLDSYFKITRITKDVMKSGFIIDPYISNFRVTRKHQKNYIEYFDLIFTNQPLDMKIKVKEITGLDL